MVAAAARVGLETVFRHAPVVAQAIGEDFGFHFIALVQRKQACIAFQYAARAGEPVLAYRWPAGYAVSYQAGTTTRGIPSAK